VDANLAAAQAAIQSARMIEKASAEQAAAIAIKSD
jgi:hypothetical protein